MKRSKTGAIVACVLFYGLSALNGGVIAPIIEPLNQMWPEIGFTWIAQLSTIANAIAIPVAIIVGAIAGKAIKFRPLIFLSMTLVAVGGILPFFIHPNFWVVFAFRVLFGFGFGISLGLQGLNIIRMFDGEEQAKVLGYAVAFLGVTTIVFPLAAGYLSDISPFHVHAVYFVALAFMIVIGILMPEPDPLPEVKKTAEDKKNARITPFAVGIIVLYIITYIAYYPMWIGTSTIIMGEGLGTGAAVGWVSTAAAIGQIAGGAVFGTCYAKMKTWLMPVSAVGCAVALVLLASAPNLPMYFAGAAVVGWFNSGFLIAAVYRVIGETQHPAAAGVLSALAGALMNAGSFITPFWMSAVAAITGNPSPRMCFWVGIPICLVVAVIMLVVLRKEYKKLNLI